VKGPLASLDSSPSETLYFIDAQKKLLDTFIKNDVADILIQHGQTGMGKSSVLASISPNTIFDPIMKEAELQRTTEDLLMFNKHPILIISGGEYLKDKDAKYLLKMVQEHEFKIIINCEDIEQVPYLLRRSAIESYFPPLTPEQVVEYLSIINHIVDDEEQLNQFRKYRDFRSINNAIESGSQDWPDIPATFKNPEEHFWFVYRFADDRQILSEIDIILTRTNEVGYRQWKYASELLKSVNMSVRRLWVFPNKLRRSIAKKLAPIIKDSFRERLRYHTVVIEKMTNPSMLYVLQGLDLTDSELKILGFKRARALKRDFKEIAKPVPQGEPIDKYF
jgi:hypothetical protein